MAVAVHAKVLPTMFAVKFTKLLVLPVQIVCVNGEFVTTGPPAEAGTVTVAVAAALQAYESFTVTVYVTPPVRPVAFAVPCPPPGAGDHVYVNAPIPAVAVAVAVPFVAPQVGAVAVADADKTFAHCKKSTKTPES